MGLQRNKAFKVKDTQYHVPPCDLDVGLLWL